MAEKQYHIAAECPADKDWRPLARRLAVRLDRELKKRGVTPTTAPPLPLAQNSVYQSLMFGPFRCLCQYDPIGREGVGERYVVRVDTLADEHGW